ncbi:MAG: hypothetical protein WCF65_03715 [Parachlamydiaceae bacterium]
MGPDYSQIPSAFQAAAAAAADVMSPVLSPRKIKNKRSASPMEGIVQVIQKGFPENPRPSPLVALRRFQRDVPPGIIDFSLPVPPGPRAFPEMVGGLLPKRRRTDEPMVQEVPVQPIMRPPALPFLGLMPQPALPVLGLVPQPALAHHNHMDVDAYELRPPVMPVHLDQNAVQGKIYELTNAFTHHIPTINFSIYFAGPLGQNGEADAEGSLPVLVNILDSLFVQIEKLENFEFIRGIITSAINDFRRQVVAGRQRYLEDRVNLGGQDRELYSVQLAQLNQIGQNQAHLNYEFFSAFNAILNTGRIPNRRVSQTPAKDRQCVKSLEKLIKVDLRQRIEMPDLGALAL